ALEELVLTDTIEATEEVKAARNSRQVPIAPLLGEAIRRIANEESVSSLFD
ncbi:MAG: phosphoribosylpyrophosphate synthetase, partial [Pseudomonadota bacterium]